MRLVESDPGVDSLPSDPMIKEHDEAGIMPLDGHVTLCLPHFNDQSAQTAF